MRKRTSVELCDVEAPAEDADEEFGDAIARPSDEFFDAVEPETAALVAAAKQHAPARRGAWGLIAGAARDLGRHARRGPAAIAAEFLASAEVREINDFLGRTSAAMRRDASDAKAEMFDVARAATADAVLKKVDGWLARQRQFAVEDPSMPRWARSALPPAFDAVATEVRRVVESCVEEELRLRARRTSAAEARAAPAAKGWLASFRRGLLYALQPYDRTSWRRNADPRYWAIKACCACPYFGIQTLSFAVVLAAIDRGDTYQLVDFLLSFKQNMFWFNGLFALVAASASLHYCVAVELSADADHCGRAAAKDLSVVLLGHAVGGLYVFSWIGQLVLGWVALFLLPGAVSKGGAVRTGHRLVGERVLWETGDAPPRAPHRVSVVVHYDRRTDAHEVRDAEGRGESYRVTLHARRYFVLGRALPMRYLFAWDVLSFGLTSGAAFAFVFAAWRRHGVVYAWQVRAALKGARVGYSLAAFPFFMIGLPIYKELFATAKQTGYTRDGVCVPAKSGADYEWVSPAG